MYNQKKKYVFAITIVCLTICLCFVGYCLAMNMYVHSLFTSAKPVENYDGRFAFLEMPTSKFHVNTLKLYDAGHKIGKQQIQSFKHQYNAFDMKKIMWGKQSYDLFFWTDEPVPYIFRYDTDSKQWIGPLYFSISATEEKRLQGIDNVYCFEDNNALLLRDTFYQVPKYTVPPELAEVLEKDLDKN